MGMHTYVRSKENYVQWQDCVFDFISYVQRANHHGKEYHVKLLCAVPMRPKNEKNNNAETFCLGASRTSTAGTKAWQDHLDRALAVEHNSCMHEQLYRTFWNNQLHLQHQGNPTRTN